MHPQGRGGGGGRGRGRGRGAGPGGGGGVVAFAWGQYFPEVRYAPDDRRAVLMGQLQTLFSSTSGRAFLRQVDFEALLACAHAAGDAAAALAANLSVALDMKPREALACLAAAAHQLMSALSEDPPSAGLPPPPPPGVLVVVRLHNHAQSRVQFRDIKSNHVDKLVSLRGTVVRCSTVRPLVQALAFACAKCGNLSSCRFPDGNYTLPASCVADGCRGKKFEPQLSTAKCVDQQRLRLEELSTPADREEGRVPRTMEVELTQGLVDTCIPGDVAVVTGLVQYTPIAGANNKSTFLLYVHALSVVKLSKGASSSPAGPQPTHDPTDSAFRGNLEGAAEAPQALLSGEQDDVRASVPPNMPKLGPADLATIARVVRTLDGFQLQHLVHSFCPVIDGHPLVKCGLLLALFGGVRKHCNQEGLVPVRGDIHVLVVGDPGLGKSQMLKAACAVAPRGLYVCGNTTSSAGLTVSIGKDPGTGDFTFEAGAMVLGDQGACCIDEFDKMGSQHQALLEAMEQQSVSVTKAGLSASLAARTTVLAAANPVQGHYNRSKTVNENLKMSPAVLSRFDLLYILIDKQDDARDRSVTRQVMARNRGGAHAPMYLESSQGGTHSRPTLALPAVAQQRMKLVERLQEIIRKYISYARQHVFPVLSPAAAEVLRGFYLQLRQSVKATDGTPITARQLERDPGGAKRGGGRNACSLIRLAEARARVELRQEVTREDAEDVVELMKTALWDQFRDERGGLDFGRSRGRSGQRVEAKRFVSALVQRSEAKGQALFSIGELHALADDLALNVRDVERFIEQLNDHGDLLKMGRQYKVSASSLSCSQPKCASKDDLCAMDEHSGSGSASCDKPY